MTLEAVGVGSAQTAVDAMITRDEVVLSVSPPGPGGERHRIVGRGLCYQEPGSNTVIKTSFGPTHTEPATP